MTDLNERLRRLALAVDRLAPSHRDPESFFVERGEIAAELRWMAQNLSSKIAPPRRPVDNQATP